jgi:Rad3-related DNA helicase
VLSADFFKRVNNYAQRQLTMHPSQSMHRFVASCAEILDRPVNQTNRFPALTVLNLTTLQAFDRNHPGGGIFLQASIEELNQLVSVLSRKDQTLTTFGFAEHELREFAKKLNGRALERIVPIGQALEFGRFWDGHDLLQAFCRNVFITDFKLPQLLVRAHEG